MSAGASGSGAGVVWSRVRRLALSRVLLWAGGVLACGGVLLGVGGASVWSGLAAVGYVALSSGVAAAAWVLGAVGLGVVARPLYGRARGVGGAADRLALRASAGIALSAWLAHALGALGLLGAAACAAPTAAGLVLLLAMPERGGGRALWALVVRAPWWSLCALALAGGVGLVASSTPPGQLWSSEGNGYDVLNYHLLLPKAWLEGGRISSLESNVYSFLPSAAESSFTQLAGWLAWLTGERSVGAGEGFTVYAGAMLHALVTGAGALVTGVVARRLALAGGVGARRSSRVGWCAAAGVGATPWVVVVGSLAYSEGFVLVSIAGSMLAAVSLGGGRWRCRSALGGLLAGSACAAKPTALVMAFPAAAAVYLWRERRRRWLWASLVGAGAASAVLMPWAARNIAASGNPVFPYLTGVFGAGHWTGEQVQRWATAHGESAGPLGRVALLLSPDRGLAHAQWSLTPWLALACAVLALSSGRLRGPTAVVASGLALSVVGWLSVGHVQSRFLVGSAAAMGVLAGLGLARASGGGGRAWWAVRAAIAGAVVLTALHGARQYAQERGGRPAVPVVLGVASLNGTTSAGGGGAGVVPTPAAMNAALERGVVVWLLGDPSALYATAPLDRLVVHTTWDRWPLGEALRAAGGDVAAALEAALEETGAGALIVNTAELGRLTRSGYADPSVTPAVVERLLALGEVHELVPGGAVVLLVPTPRGAGRGP